VFLDGPRSYIFGTTERAEVTHKLAERIALFLADSPEVGRELFRKVKKCYGTRSQIMHGRWKHDPSINTAMADTEDIVRTVLLRLAANESLTKKFISSARERFLEELVFANLKSIHNSTTGGDASGH
jgi:hypothetical protein